MTKENKQLLLQDLCARLPYYPKCKIIDEIRLVNNEKDTIYISTLFPKHIELLSHNNFTIKPYLRPMSSMTEEEYDDMFHQFYSAQEEFFRNCSNTDTIRKIITYDMVRYDWLNKKMFDFRGLIPKGLAIEVTENDNPYKD